jgi:hypothetical protein
MSALDSKLRSQLDCVCQKAREKAEEAARSALQKRAVDAAEPHPHFTAVERALRNRLRARGRQAGDVRQANKTQGIEQLSQELAYEYWHRMLFARFLAENQLLMHPNGVAVSLEECEELAKSEEATDGFALAARYASTMLPQVFRTDDVLLEIEFAPEHRLALEKLLAALPRETFLADDSLGWVYQFWQSKKKKQVNDSGQAIDGRTLPAVTQLFTEDYMVQFLLHNTIGAWWCARHEIKGPSGGAGIPADKAPVEVPYLRWRDDGTLAAGTFDGWPKTLNEFRLLDPCCGSGHFLVAAFNLLVPLRMRDDGLTARGACDAVLRENLFGLELDPRCTQIAAFALAVAAWKYPAEDGQPLGYRELPSLNIACAGIGPQATEDEWLRLAEQSGKPMSVLSREPILNGLRNLHALFSDAPTLGSLIDPNQLSADLISADYETLQPYLAAALTAEYTDDDAHERAVAAAGMVKAAELLAGEYTLVVTNVPYLGRGKQGQTLKDYSKRLYSHSMWDLATVFLERCLALTATGGSAAIVSPSGWLSLKTYEKLRLSLVASRQWMLVARLGPRAFETISGEVVNVTLVVLCNARPDDRHTVGAVDVSDAIDAQEKANQVRRIPLQIAPQGNIRKNPSARFVFSEYEHDLPRLGTYCSILQGSSTGDDPKFVRCFWEVSDFENQWKLLLSAPDNGIASGREYVWRWPDEDCELAHFPEARIRGKSSWGREGFVVAGSSTVTATVYRGEFFNKLLVTIIPNDWKTAGAVWKYICAQEFSDNVRKLDTKNLITPGVFASVPFDLERWTALAKGDELPTVLQSNDPTQWLFNGCIPSSTAPLQVVIARLLGYCWPPEEERPHLGPLPEGNEMGGMSLSTRTRKVVSRSDELLRFADDDGIVCIPAVRAESPAAERVLDVLHAAYGLKWSNSLLHDLLTDADCKPGTTLDEWLRNDFFEQHWKRFNQRPFVWQIWDGRKDGFSCLVNYHKLNYKTLDNLTHSYLEGWIKKQAGDAKTGKAGADLRLAAAQTLQQKLKLILTGEPPYDIFVRWKPLHEQPIGWNPDLNDGVRMNIRPFVKAGILRKNPNINWTKDRGKEPERDKDDYPWFWKGKEFTGERVNDVHLTNAEKQAARSRKGG